MYVTERGQNESSCTDCLWYRPFLAMGAADGLDELMDLLTYECPFSGKKRVAGSSPLTIEKPLKRMKYFGFQHISVLNLPKLNHAIYQYTCWKALSLFCLTKDFASGAALITIQVVSKPQFWEFQWSWGCLWRLLLPRPPVLNPDEFHVLQEDHWICTSANLQCSNISLLPIQCAPFSDLHWAV